MRILFCLFLLASLPALSQPFTKADSLRGMLSPQRSCFDVTFYELDVVIDPELKEINGNNAIHFVAKRDFDSLQIDLFEHLVIDSIISGRESLAFSRQHNAVFVSLSQRVKKDESGTLTIFYHGSPIAAKSPPWDGGFVWRKDSLGNHHIGVACQGMGASSWWPNKDHLSDEPDSMLMHFTAPAGLMCVGNGQFLGSQENGDQTRWSWKVNNPINNYNATVNIGDYVHFQDYHLTGKDSLQLNYYVLRDNLDKARKHFQSVKPMLSIFEAAFGPYPFYNDGYALVETPYVGMEHQSAIAYGNKYQKGYSGRFPSDMDFDYIIVHETGHEWWGNSVSMNDIADMWVHESFCTYSEAIFVEATYGYAKMLEYLKYQKKIINNKSPILGVRNVNQEGNSRDMYYKGSWMLHTLRSVVNDDAKFKALLKAIATKFRHSNVDGTDVIVFISDSLGMDMTAFFSQYLSYTDLPTLQYHVKGNKLSMRWNANEADFAMPMEFTLADGSTNRVDVKKDEWTTVTLRVPEPIQFHEHRFLFVAEKVKKR